MQVNPTSMVRCKGVSCSDLAILEQYITVPYHQKGAAIGAVRMSYLKVCHSELALLHRRKARKVHTEVSLHVQVNLFPLWAKAVNTNQTHCMGCIGNR